MRPPLLAIKCFYFRDLQIQTVNIRTNSQVTRVTFSRVYSAVQTPPPYLDSHIYIDFFIWLFDIEARIRKLGVRVIITYAHLEDYIY